MKHFLSALLLLTGSLWLPAPALAQNASTASGDTDFRMTLELQQNVGGIAVRDAAFDWFGVDGLTTHFETRLGVGVLPWLTVFGEFAGDHASRRALVVADSELRILGGGVRARFMAPLDFWIRPYGSVGAGFGRGRMQLESSGQILTGTAWTGRFDAVAGVDLRSSGPVTWGGFVEMGYAFSSTMDFELAREGAPASQPVDAGSVRVDGFIFRLGFLVAFGL